MNNLTSIQERYKRDTLAVRLGGLAANLARVKSFSNDSTHCEAVKYLLEESKYFIEWTAPDADLPLQSELVELQLKLAQWERDWQRIWTNPEERNAIAVEAGDWSDRILGKSGLLNVESTNRDMKNLKTVESSMIRAVGYDRKMRVLEVVFNSGETYRYEGVSPDVYKDLMNASSKGRYMHDEIIDVYPYTLVSRR
ncbi:MAG TPA: KTSC domain-containing protein [Blastocatellia bacterium]|nr:KTSC domain-containing protein [Blastocatellia bacterium]